MSDKPEKDGFEAITEFWQQSQEAFFKAQEDISEQFGKSLKEMAATVEREASDPVAAWNAMIKAWAPDWSDFGHKTDGFKDSQQAFFEMLSPQNWTKYAPEQLRVMLERVAAGPKFADMAMPQQEMAGAWREVTDYQKAAADMSSVMQQAWTNAYKEFSETHSLEDLKSGDVNGALDSWLKAANKALLEAQGSDAFLDAQRRMIRASTEIRARQRDMAENWSTSWQMPTRSEVDDLAQTVHGITS